MRRGLWGYHWAWALALMFFALVCAATSARAGASAASKAQPPQSTQGTTTPHAATPQGASSPQSTRASASTSQTPPDALHYITVTFDYDFTKTPPCSTSKKHAVHPCAGQFSIFETTNGTSQRHRILLFNVPLPPYPQGVVKGITLKSPQKIDLVLGWHKLGVAAMDPIGWESTLQFCDSCATWINVQAGPTTTTSVPAPGSSVTPPGVTPPSSATPTATPTPARSPSH